MIENFPQCKLTHPIYLVAFPGVWEKAINTHGKFIPNDRRQLEIDLARLSTKNGLPVVLESFKDGNPRLVFCTERFEVGCGLTEGNKAYKLAFLAPLTPQRRVQLAKQAVMVVTSYPAPWRVVDDYFGLKGQELHSGFDDIRCAWETATCLVKDQSKARQLTPDHYKFLSDVENLINFACDVERDKHTTENVVVVKFSSVSDTRQSRSVYQFDVMQHHFKIGDRILFGLETPDERGPGFVGTIEEATSQTLRVSFHKDVDASFLENVQWIKPFVSLKQYEIQKSALEALRNDRSANPYLLDVIVGGAFQPPKGAQEISSVGKLNPSQSKAVCYADQIPDMLMVIGPPGTGKTESIVEIAKRFTRRKQKVLITSKNNMAVDNVLGKLTDLEVLRIGREEKISDAIQPLTIDAKATQQQANILTSTESVWRNMKILVENWSQLDAKLCELELDGGKWQQAVASWNLEQQKLKDWEDEMYKPFQPILARLQKQVQIKDKQIARKVADLRTITQHIDSLSKLTRIPIVNIFIHRMAENAKKQIQELILRKQMLIDAREHTQKDTQRIFESYKTRITSGPEALEKKKKIEQALNRKIECEMTIQNFLEHLLKFLARFENAPQIEPNESPSNLPAFIQKMRSWHEFTKKRYILLTEWRELLGSRHQALYPNLIRMADVVGATCIGIANDAHFEDLKFDLVIADEAGQIQVMDLLVPLVRAKKAILVGDHKQLPPIADDEIKARVEEIEKRMNEENTEQREWLEKSLFERIIEGRVPDDRKVMLDTQYRMPAPIAEFISNEFYEGKYKTGHNKTYSPLFFQHTMTFIDTSPLPTRRETRQKGSDDNDGGGYTNELEAQLIASMVQAFQNKEQEWGVIVPYKKQAALIKNKLENLVIASELKDWIATVDSFQGKERNVIIYGFTRSNSNGRIGFLKELRRLNVSLTRARQQLVIVGDASFLENTGDKNFSHLCKQLLSTVRKINGAYIYASQLGDILSASKNTI